MVANIDERLARLVRELDTERTARLKAERSLRAYQILHAGKRTAVKTTDSGVVQSWVTRTACLTLPGLTMAS